MKRRNFFTSLLMGLGVLVGLGSCQDSCQDDPIANINTSTDIINNDGVIVSSSYDNKESPYYRALIPNVCYFEVFKVFDNGQEDESLNKYVDSIDKKDGILISEDIQKYKILKTADKEFGKDYYVNFNDDVFDVSYKKYQWLKIDTDMHIKKNPIPKYYVAIVCPKGNWDIEATINGIPNKEVKELKKENIVSYDKNNDTYSKEDEIYKNKSIYYIPVNKGERVSFYVKYVSLSGVIPKDGSLSSVRLRTGIDDDGKSTSIHERRF